MDDLYKGLTGSTIEETPEVDDQVKDTIKFEKEVSDSMPEINQNTGFELTKDLLNSMPGVDKNTKKILKDIFKVPKDSELPFENNDKLDITYMVEYINKHASPEVKKRLSRDGDRNSIKLVYQELIKNDKDEISKE